MMRRAGARSNSAISPLAVMCARSPDRFAAKDNSSEPIRVLPTMRALLAGVPAAPIATQIEFASEQIMLGGRPLQDVAAELRGSTGAWTVRRLEFRAPGTTKVSLSSTGAQTASPDHFNAALSVESTDPDALVTWLQGRSELNLRSQKSLRLRGDVSVAPNLFSIDGMKAELDGGAVEGWVVASHRQPGGVAQVTADLKAERLDLDAAAALVRSLAGPQAEWPEEAQLSLEIGRAISSGQELRPLAVKLGYTATTISLDQLKIGRADGVMMEGGGSFDRASATGKLTLNSSAASFNQLTALIAPLAPSLVARLNAMGTGQGAARAKLALDLDKIAGQADRVSARAVLDLDTPQLKGITTLTAKPTVAAISGIDMEMLRRSEAAVESKLRSEERRV